MRRVLLTLSLLIAAAAVAALIAKPDPIIHRPTLPEIDTEVDEWLRRREDAIHRQTPLVPNTEKRIRWHAPAAKEKTEFAVVYLHGFSATRQEISPVGEWVADRLQANLFETRLTAHGLTRAPLVDVTAEQWLDDGAEALAVGAAIGKRIVLLGTSTGATLAISLVDHPGFQPVSHLILMSPNFAPLDKSAEVLTWPGGPQLARLLVGPTHSWEPANEDQGRYWATSYPLNALVEMMRLVKQARTKLPVTVDQPVLVVYSPQDSVVDPQRIEAAFAEISSPLADLVAIETTGDPSNHVLAGDILAPESNRRIAELVSTFVQSHRL